MRALSTFALVSETGKPKVTVVGGGSSKELGKSDSGKFCGVVNSSAFAPVSGSLAALPEKKPSCLAALRRLDSLAKQMQPQVGRSSGSMEKGLEYGVTNL